MANPDRWFDDRDRKDEFSWLPFVMVAIGIIYILILLFSGSDSSNNTNTCTTYYQGDEMISDCE